VTIIQVSHNLRSLPDILPSLQGSCATVAVDSSVLAPAAMGHIDIVSKLTPIQGNYTSIIAGEYFTKWVEAKPVTNITSATIQKFFWQYIICRYRVPQQITIDNAKYFDSAMFKDFCH
jgi:hypothetical protein